MSWWNKKKNTDQNSQNEPNLTLVAQDPRMNVRTTSAATSTTNTAVQNSTIIDNNKNTVTYQSTRQTVTHTQQANVTEILHRRTPNLAEMEELLASIRLGKEGTSTTTTTTLSTRSRPPSLNGVALRSTPTFKATINSSGAKRSSLIAKMEKTTMTQNQGRTVTQHVETQRVELSPKKYWQSSSSSSTTPSTSEVSKPYVSPYAQEKPSSYGYATQLKPLSTFSTSYTPSTASTVKTPSASSKVLTSTAVPKPYNSLKISSAGTTKNNFSDAKRSFEKPTTSLSTFSQVASNPKKKLKPARVYILNHEKFDTNHEDRAGSAQDVKALRKTFDYFKCEVKVITNATVATVRSMVHKLESKCFKEQSALVIVVLTHGTRYDNLAAKDSEYSLDDDVIFPILRNQTLKEKPKLIFIQACKGARTVGSFKTDAVQPHGSPSEIYKCYSTYEGYVSYRTEDGTPFIQTLCETLQKFGQTKDIDEIMTEVRTVVKATSHDGQIPSVTSTLTKKYVFGEYM